MDSYPLHLADLTWTLAQEPNPDGAPADTTETTGGGDGTTPATEEPAGNPFGMLIWIAPLLIIWIFLLGRGGKAQKKKQAEMLASMTKGSKIVTVGGIKGSVVDVRDDEVLVKVDESANTRLRFTRDAIRSVLSDDKAEQTDK